ncbi:MAG TPA: hypothetical protein VN688_01540 [Gemmataceae bacterium]|nr:hypothetical protein [Gemmataceae bacterium]
MALLQLIGLAFFSFSRWPIKLESRIDRLLGRRVSPSFSEALPETPDLATLPSLGKEVKQNDEERGGRQKNKHQSNHLLSR